MSAKRLLSTNDSQQKLIREGVAGNLELQTIVLNVIQDYKAEQVARAGAVAGSSGTRCEQLVEKRKLAGKKISANATMAPPAPRRPQAQLSDDPGVILNPETQLPKNCKKYAGWKPDLLLELFEYAEPSLFSAAQKSVDGRKLTRQLFEYAFGLKAGAIPEEVSKCDRPATLDKVRTFAALRALYIANGRLFRSLELTDGGVDWFKAGQGVYELQASSGGGDTPSGAAAPAPGAAALFVFDRISRRKAPVDPTLVGVQGPGEFLKLKIRFDFSLSSAGSSPRTWGRYRIRASCSSLISSRAPSAACAASCQIPWRLRSTTSPPSKGRGVTWRAPSRTRYRRPSRAPPAPRRQRLLRRRAAPRPRAAALRRPPLSRRWPLRRRQRWRQRRRRRA